MTKGQRRRKREQSRQSAEQRKKQGTPVAAEATQTVHDTVEEGHRQTPAEKSEGTIEMPIEAGIAEWIRQNANPIIAVFTIVIAVIASIQACIYKSQLDSMHLEQRAWVGISGVHLQVPYSPEHLGMVIVLTNTGKLPAYINDGIDIMVGSSEPPFKEAHWFLRRHLSSKVVFSPNIPMPLQISEDNPISGGDFKSLEAKGKQHWFQAVLKYRDPFDIPRETTVCAILWGKQEDMAEGHPFPSCGGDMK